MFLIATLIVISLAQRAHPDFPPVNEQCEDDAGPRWIDDIETFGRDKFYWSDSHARAVLNQDGTCPPPVEEACQTRTNPLQAFVEGPISCPDAWACRIYPDPNHGSGFDFLGDRNFGNCDQASGLWEDTNTDQDGHCHGGLDPSSYYWWVRDHWNRPYSGRVKCCCVGTKTKGDGRVTMDLDGIANRCDYRARVTVGADNCRDANEDHAGGRMGSGFLYGYDGVNDRGCPRNGNRVAYTKEPADEMCWEILNFGIPDRRDNDPTISRTSTGPCTGAGSATGGSCDGVEAFPGQFSGPDAPQYVRPSDAGPVTPISSQTPINTNRPEATSAPDSDSGSSNNGELNGAILAIGDSWIDSEFELGTLSQNCASKTVINLGASGSTAQQWLSGDINLAEARDEDVTFTHAYVSLGGNDQVGAGCRTSALTSIASDLTAINNQVRSIYGQSIQIVMTGYGMGPDPATDGCDDDTLRQFQVMISQVAQETGATFVDVRNLFKTNPSDEVGQSQYFVDAIHLNRAGYNRMWQLPALQSAFNCGGSSDGGNNIGGGSGGEQPSDSSDAENSSSDSRDDEEESTSNESETTPDASFYASETESCPTGSYIIDEETCIAAARSLGLAKELTRSFNNHMRTRGCYVKSNKVYFNENPTLTSNRSRRNSICCSSDNCTSDASDEEEYEEEAEYEEEEAEPTVFVSENGSCPSPSNYVSKLSDCREAADSLGFSRVKSFRNPNRLRGCYVFRNRAWFNRDTSAVEQPYQTNRKSVCVNSA